MADKDLEYWDDDGGAFKAIVRDWPKEVRSAIGADLRRVQRGEQPRNGKWLHNFCVACAEIKHKGGARVVYSVAFTDLSGKVFIADAFMKDSGDGNEMRPADQRRIQGRLRAYRTKYLARQRSRLH